MPDTDTNNIVKRGDLFRVICEGDTTESCGWVGGPMDRIVEKQALCQVTNYDSTQYERGNYLLKPVDMSEESLFWHISSLERVQYHKFAHIKDVLERDQRIVCENIAELREMAKAAKHLNYDVSCIDDKERIKFSADGPVQAIFKLHGHPHDLSCTGWSRVYTLTSAIYAKHILENPLEYNAKGEIHLNQPLYAEHHNANIEIRNYIGFRAYTVYIGSIDEDAIDSFL